MGYIEFDAHGGEALTLVDEVKGDIIWPGLHREIPCQKAAEEKLKIILIVVFPVVGFLIIALGIL